MRPLIKLLEDSPPRFEKMLFYKQRAVGVSGAIDDGRFVKSKYFSNGMVDDQANDYDCHR